MEGIGVRISQHVFRFTTSNSLHTLSPFNFYNKILIDGWGKCIDYHDGILAIGAGSKAYGSGWAMVIDFARLKRADVLSECLIRMDRVHGENPEGIGIDERDLITCSTDGMLKVLRFGEE